MEESSRFLGGPPSLSESASLIQGPAESTDNHAAMTREPEQEMTQSPLTAAVVIATFDEGRWLDLEEAVDSVYAQDPPPNEVIIGVDHNPALFARVSEAYPDAVVVENAGLQGASDNRNTAAEAAKSDLLVFLDDDAVAHPGWLAALCDAAAEPDALGAGGFLIPRWLHSQKPTWFPEEFGWIVGVSYLGQPTSRAQVRNVWSGSMVVDAEAFRAVGGFRAGFGKIGNASRPEDTDLCIRVASSHPGRSWYFEPTALAEHKVPSGRRTLRYFVTRSWAEGRGKIALGDLVGHRVLIEEGTFGALVIPRGIARELSRAARGDRSALARAGGLILGLLVTVAGAIAELASGLTRSRRRAGQ